MRSWYFNCVSVSSTSSCGFSSLACVIRLFNLLPIGTRTFTQDAFGVGSNQWWDHQSDDAGALMPPGMAKKATPALSGLAPVDDPLSSLHTGRSTACAWRYESSGNGGFGAHAFQPYRTHEPAPHSTAKLSMHKRPMPLPYPVLPPHPTTQAIVPSMTSDRTLSSKPKAVSPACRPCDVSHCSLGSDPVAT